METRYNRNIPSISPEEQEHLRESRVCVAGCGGLGGYVIEYLVRLGVGHITAVDGDAFEESNLNRQLLCTASTLGQSKAESALERALLVDPEAHLTPVCEMLNAENCRSIIAGHELVIDALDSVEARLVLSSACSELGLTLIHGAVCGWSVQAAVVTPGSGLIERLYASAPRLAEKTCLPFTPPFCAGIQTAEAVNVLCSRPSPLQDRLLLADLLSMELRIVEI